MPRGTRPRLITFDCYGTLIDWCTGVRRAAAPLLGRRGVDADSDFFQAWWHVDRELTIERPYAPYREVLVADFEGAFARLGLELSNGEARRLAAGLVDWPPFADAAAGLGRLRDAGFELGILSNIDDDLLATSIARLGVDFDHLVTAESLRSYKPAPAHFDRIAQLTGYAPAEILHAAASLRVDVVPAKAAGFGTVLVERAEPDTDTPITPDHTVRDLHGLTDLVDLVG